VRCRFGAQRSFIHSGAYQKLRSWHYANLENEGTWKILHPLELHATQTFERASFADCGEWAPPILIALSESLGKWAGLEFLLHQALSTDHERAECAADHLGRWILTANRKFVAPSVYQVHRLTNLLRLAQSRHPRRDWRPIDRGLAAFS
jgi:hypothetical protein